MSSFIGRIPLVEPAVLPDYAAYLMRAKRYPAIVRKAAACTKGLLYLDLTVLELHKLDRYEGREYQRTVLKVSTEGGKQIDAWVYVLNPGYRSLLSRQPWTCSSQTRT